MAESIAVGYRQLGGNWYHKFIVYTDSNGNQWVTSAWAGKKGDVKFSDFSQSGSSGSGSSGSDWGSIVTKGGTSDPRRYDSNYDDYPKNSDGRDRYPGKNIKFETVKTGDNLSGDWKKVTDAMDAIAGEKHQYRPLDQNSNTTADEALRRAGIPEPKGDGFGDNWAPGSENNLPGGSDDAGGGGLDGDYFKAIMGLLPSLIPSLVPLQWAFRLAELWLRRDPIILDLDGDGVETLAQASGRHFDHDGNGFAEQTGWVGAEDGLLIRDRQPGAAITSGSQLFGDFTLLSNGTTAAHGFEALADLDDNHDGVIDQADAAWAELAIWKDSNSDAYFDVGERLSLEQAGVGRPGAVGRPSAGGAG